MTQPALFDTTPEDDTTHVLVPSMGYACGRLMLEVGGHFTVGISDWTRVDCPDCLALGADTIQAEIHRQQSTQA